VEQQKADVRQVADRGASGDDAARFLRELRQLRDGAGLGQAELAAKAHYPHDFIRAAEIGPSLPDLPVLSAYVRGCGGTTEEWEERWRSLTRTPSQPLSAARQGGNSAAASAGARIGSVAQEADTPDPSIILAALNRVAEEMASAPAPAPAPAPADSRSWASDPADRDTDLPARPDSGVPTPTAPAEGKPAEGKPAAWDPIRVSTAWPALPDSAPAASRETPPWETAPRTPGRAGRTRAGLAADREAPAAAGTPTAPVTPAPAAARPSRTAAGQPGTAAPPGHVRPAGTATGPRAAQVRIAVLCVVLLCVLAVLLAVFV
jgi:Helix-turn-helix domain